MNPLSIVCLAVCLFAAACATHNQHSSNSINNNLRPSQWLSVAELESLPALNEITLQRLESLSVDKGAELIDAIYHLSQLSREVQPNYNPRPNQIPAYIVKSNGENFNFTLDQLPNVVKPQQNFAAEEVTIVITGLPQSLHAVGDANQRLVNAYKARYNLQPQHRQQQQDSSEEEEANGNNNNPNNNHNNNNHNNPNNSHNNNYSNNPNNNNNNRNNHNSNNPNNNHNNNPNNNHNNNPNNNNNNSGDLVVIEMGEVLNSVERLATVNIGSVGNALGNIIAEAIENANVPQELINIVAQGVSAHIAGAAARQYTRRTGHQLRRITALDPSKVFAKNANTLNTLSRGAAEFVDAIHTTAYGLGTPARVGDIDFYPNGPSEGVPGAENQIQASMRATCYFAESVRPGNERNFPAVAATSLQQYKNNNGNGRRVYMGVATKYDEEGDYILQVNPSSPYGQNAPAHKQNGYHGRHTIPQNMESQDY